MFTGRPSFFHLLNYGEPNDHSFQVWSKNEYVANHRAFEKCTLSKFCPAYSTREV